MGMESKVLCMNGELVEFAKATIPWPTPALHYGAAVFEGIRSYATDRGPAVFRLREPIERLLQSAYVLGFRELPYAVEQLSEAVKRTVRVSGFHECTMRPILYLDSGGVHRAT